MAMSAGENSQASDDQFQPCAAEYRFVHVTQSQYEPSRRAAGDHTVHAVEDSRPMSVPSMEIPEPPTGVRRANVELMVAEHARDSGACR
jgi:hypothetical protein